MLGQLELNSYTDRLLGYVQALDKNYVFNNYWKMSRLERKTANEKEPGIVQKHFLYIASFGTKTINSRFLGAAKVYGCLINSKLLPLQQIIPGSVDTAPNNCELKKNSAFHNRDITTAVSNGQCNQLCTLLESNTQVPPCSSTLKLQGVHFLAPQYWSQMFQQTNKAVMKKSPKEIHMVKTKAQHPLYAQSKENYGQRTVSVPTNWPNEKTLRLQ